MRKLFINSVRTDNPGQFTLWERSPDDSPHKIIEIGNYLEVMLHKKLGVTGQLKGPREPQDIRSYEMTIWHSLVHSSQNAELIRFDCPAKTVDALLKEKEPGDTLQLRPHLVSHVTRNKKTGKPDQHWKWYVIAVNGVYWWRNEEWQVPHSKFEFLHGDK